MICLRCHAFKPKNQLKACGGCTMTWYCGKHCQRAHWRHHKRECAELKAVRIAHKDVRAESQSATHLRSLTMMSPYWFNIQLRCAQAMDMEFHKYIVFQIEGFGCP